MPLIWMFRTNFKGILFGLLCCCLEISVKLCLENEVKPSESFNEFEPTVYREIFHRFADDQPLSTKPS